MYLAWWISRNLLNTNISTFSPDISTDGHRRENSDKFEDRPGLSNWRTPFLHIRTNLSVQTVKFHVGSLRASFARFDNGKKQEVSQNICPSQNSWQKLCQESFPVNFWENFWQKLCQEGFPVNFWENFWQKLCQESFPVNFWENFTDKLFRKLLRRALPGNLLKTFSGKTFKKNLSETFLRNFLETYWKLKTGQTRQTNRQTDTLQLYISKISIFHHRPISNW